MFEDFKLKKKLNKTTDYFKSIYKGKITFDEFEDIEEQKCITCLYVLYQVYDLIKILRIEDKFEIYQITDKDLFNEYPYKTIAFVNNSEILDFEHIFKTITRLNTYVHIENLSFETFKGMVMEKDGCFNMTNTTLYMHIAMDFVDYSKEFVYDFEKFCNGFFKDHYDNIQDIYIDFRNAISSDDNFKHAIAGYYNDFRIIVSPNKSAIDAYKSEVRDKFFDLSESYIADGGKLPNGIKPIVVSDDKVDKLLDVLGMSIEELEKYKISSDDLNDDFEDKEESKIDYSKLN